jgi:hypothetical protein
MQKSSTDTSIHNMQEEIVTPCSDARAGASTGIGAATAKTTITAAQQISSLCVDVPQKAEALSHEV